jgi:hypothetical protein
MRWKQIEIVNYGLILALSVLALLVVQVMAKSLLPHLESRPGFAIWDPVLEALPARDVSALIFWVLYPVVALGFAWAALEPGRFVRIFLALAFMHLFRFLCICAVPLYAPEQLIVLQDPIVDSVIYKGFFLRRDLFYSGHFASLFLLFIFVRKSHLRWLFLFASGVVGVGVLIQHVHYTYDVLGAIPFCYLSDHCARRIWETICRWRGVEMPLARR